MKRFRSGLFWAWVLAGAAAAKMVALKIYDPDLWWHLAAGREMARSGAILRTDVFSFTLLGSPWLNFEWLSEIAFYAVHAAFGLGGLFYLKVLAAPVILLLVAGCMRAAGGRGVWLLTGAWLGYLTLVSRIYERVEIFSLILLPLFLLIVLKARQRTDSSARRAPLVLGLLMILWCNLHGGFIYGLGTLILLDLGARLAGDRPAFIRTLDLSVLAVAAATFVNPYGPRIYLLFAELLRSQAGMSLILEWNPPSLTDLPYFWIVYGLAGSTLAWGLLRRKSSARFWGPAAFAFALWGTRYYRNAAIAIVILLPFITGVLCNGGPAWIKRVPAWTGALAAIVLLAVPYRIYAKPWPTDYLQRYRFPVGATAFLNRENIQGRIYNAYEFGGYLEWIRGPEHKVFMDGRYLFLPHLLKEVDLDQMLLAQRDPAPWASYLNLARIDHAVVGYNQVMVPPAPNEPAWTSTLEYRFPSDTWALVYWDDSALVYLRRGPAFAEIIRRHEFKALRPASPDWTRWRMSEDKAFQKQALEELERNRRENGFTVTGEKIREGMETKKAG